MKSDSSTSPFLRLLQNFSWLLAGDAAVKVGLLAVSVLVARGMGPADMGVFTVAVGMVMIAVPLAALGQVEALIREVAARPRQAAGLVAAARRGQWRFLAWALPAAVVLVLASTRGELRLTLLAFLPYVPLRMETMTHGAAFKGLDRMDVEVKARLAELAVVLSGTGAAVLLAWPVWVAGLSFSLGAVVGLAAVRSPFRRLVGAAPAGDLPWMWQGLPFLGIAVLFQLLVRADAPLMALLGLSQEQIGRYGAATTVTWGLLALPQVIALAVYPELSRRASTRASSLAPALAAGAAGLGLGTALAVLLVTLRDPLVRLVFGSRFAASADLLEILGWALPGACASMILGVVVAAWHAQRWAFAWLAVTVLLAATLDLLWIPRFGAVGAARGALVAHSVGAVGYVALACAAGRLAGRSDG